MQVDGSAGKSKGSAFTDADNSSIVRIYADGRAARESERALFHSKVGQGISCISKGQSARSRFGQGSACPHDVGCQGTSVSHVDTTGNVITCRIRTGGGIRIGQRPSVECNIPFRSQRSVSSNGKNAAIEYRSSGIGVGQV